MTEPAEKFKDLDFLVTRIGMPAFILGVGMWFHFHEFAVFRREINWKLERSIRNERSIMQKLGIAVILDGDRSEGKQ
jgi:hypothetical protein